MRSECIAHIIKEDWKNRIIFVRKSRERQNIQQGCNKLAGICRELELPGKMLTWDMDEDGDRAEHVKGVDDYLYDLEQNK